MYIAGALYDIVVCGLQYVWKRYLLPVLCMRKISTEGDLWELNIFVW